MIKFSILFGSVLTFFVFLIPGFILRKSGLAKDGFAKEISVFLLYIAQPAMFLHGFAIRFDNKTLINLIFAFIFSFVAHACFYFLSNLLFKKAPDKKRRVLRYAVVFSNAGYMGIPIVSDVFGDEYVIYATVFVMWFNIFAFTLGKYIYTNDTSDISFKSLLNPTIISILIGFMIYILGIGNLIQDNRQTNEFVKIVYGVVTTLKNTVAPLSMTVVGVRLADVDFKGVLRDKYLYFGQFVKLVLFPFILWLIMLPFKISGMLPNSVFAILFVLSSTPSAAFTTIFAELYGGDAPYAGSTVAVSTLISLITMPFMALLLI